MLDIKFIRAHSEEVKKAILEKHVDLNLDELLQVDAALKEQKQRQEALQQERNANAKAIKSAAPEERTQYIQKGKQIAEAIQEIKPKLQVYEQKLQTLMLKVPNIPDPEAPRGINDTENVVLRQEGDIRQFNFTPKDHVDLLEAQGWADFKRIPEVAGSRNYSLMGEGLMLEQAVLLYAINLLSSHGFEVRSVPSLVREAPLFGTGHFPSGRDQVYHLEGDELYLSGTAEVPINSLYAGEILSEEDLPLKIGGYSPCFRREAGSAGRDVRGLIRVHQFLKVEQFVICKNDLQESKKWQHLMLGISEQILKDFNIPYQVIDCCTGDMGLGKYRMYDLEAWVPSENKYRETHSCSSLHEWQSRRTKTRYRTREGEVLYCHTLNNTAVATPRMLVPLIENNQTADGRVNLPKVLRPFMKQQEVIGKPL